jgi:hypothetical protein
MKLSRHAKIYDLIDEYNIETQDELVDRLRKSGYDVTQATVSRDIRELKLSKVKLGNGKKKYAVIREKTDPTQRLIRTIKDGLLSSELAGNILVLKTNEGMAMAVAAAIDNLKFEEVVGCIAGDDTIMCVVKTVEDGKSLKQKINEIN